MKLVIYIPRQEIPVVDVLAEGDSVERLLSLSKTADGLDRLASRLRVLDLGAMIGRPWILFEAMDAAAFGTLSISAVVVVSPTRLFSLGDPDLSVLSLSSEISPLQAPCPPLPHCSCSYAIGEAAIPDLLLYLTVEDLSTLCRAFIWPFLLAAWT